jgi:DNA-binding transcriptional LysR family regulator
MNPDADVIFRRFTSKAKFRHLGLLIKLYDLRNMKRAAEALGLTQPAVSLAVAELEKLLGVQLFMRHARGVEPTQVTTELLPVARRIMAAVGDGSEIVSNVVNESAGFVRVAATPAAISAMLHPCAQTFARKFPALHIAITEINAANPLEPISDGSCDILALRQHTNVPENWVFEEVLPDALVVVCGVNNPLAKQGQASLEELRAHHWLVTRRGSIARDRFEDLAEEIQLPAANRCGVVTHVPTLTLELLTRQNYLALIPRSVAVPWLNDGLVVEIDSPATTRLAPLGFLWQPDSTRRSTRKLATELMSLRR